MPTALTALTVRRSAGHSRVPTASHRRGAWYLRCVISVLTLFVLSPSLLSANDGFITVAVQFRVSEDLLSGGDDFLQAFERRVSDLVARAANEHNADLIVFPEYANVFPLAAPDAELMRTADSLEDAVAALLEHHEARDLSSLLAARAVEASPALLSMWAGLAARYKVAIVPGTFFWRRADVHETGGMNESPELVNRLVVFDAHGDLIYHQDKAYLTPEERRIFKLSPGTVESAQPFVIEGTRVSATICRDSYFARWDARLGEADLWIDLRANGERYSPRVRERFLDTLPQRVSGTAVAAGVSATLTGSFLDLFWEGPAYAVDAAGHRLGESPSVVGTSFIIARLHERGVEVSIDASVPNWSP